MTCQRLDVFLCPVFSLKPCSICLSFSLFISLLCLSLFIPSINHLSVIVPCKLNTHLGDCMRESASWFGFCYTHKKGCFSCRRLATCPGQYPASCPIIAEMDKFRNLKSGCFQNVTCSFKKLHFTKSSTHNEVKVHWEMKLIY